jgi:cytochrome c oxidase assembly protein subunit 15
LYNSPSEFKKDVHVKIAYWLLGVCALIFVMVVIGGVTRLTGSGLSMVEWAPVTGFIPPLNEADWQRLFDSYRQYPEFLIVNKDMDLQGFKGIFWLEFIHRVFGRLIGLAFLLPFVYFMVRRMISATLAPKLIVLFILGGLQGLLGWYMVKSGLVDDPHVSQYRLTAHLMLALAIYSYMLWVALDIIAAHRPFAGDTQFFAKLSNGALALLVLATITIVSGGFVAGLKAGLIYNTFPLMGDSLVAPGVYAMQPWYLSALEDAITVQFNHRLLAISTFLFILVYVFSSWRLKLPKRTNILMALLLIAACIQVTLGISTLLLRVPVAIASAHQAGAMLLLTALILLYHHLKRENRAPVI